MGLSLSRRRPSPWADLPPELAGLILCRLLSHGDRLSFRAVCRQWRLAARRQRPLPPALPWLSLRQLPLRTHPAGVADCFCSLDGWLLYEHHSSCRPRVLVNAFSGATTRVPPRRPRDDGVNPPAGGAVSAASLNRKMIGQGRCYEGLAFHRGKLYTLTVEGDLLAREVVDGDVVGESHVDLAHEVVDGDVIGESHVEH
ncbi:hypothetical protein ACP70R_047900 [Stipagrostis hirtigluma subsp. patula]